MLTVFASSQYCWLLLCTATCCFRIKSVLLVTAVHCHMLTVFASSQYCWLLLCSATCWLFSHELSTVGYSCALPCCFRIESVLLVTAVHCHMLTVFASSQYCWLLLCTATCCFCIRTLSSTISKWDCAQHHYVQCSEELQQKVKSQHSLEKEYKTMSINKKDTTVN